MRIGFLFNHEANHQIAHTMPIAASLAARGMDVEVLAFSPAQQAAAQAIVPPPAPPHNPVCFTLLSPGPLAQADTLLRHIAPFCRLAVLRHNLPTLAPGDPVRVDLASTRPGGTARVQDGTIILPVQDCRTTYGGALRELVIHRLTQTEFEAADRPCLSASAWMASYCRGLHTLSAAGPASLIDVKMMENSLPANAIRLQRLWASRRKK